jgi:hypothetical protein
MKKEIVLSTLLLTGSCMASELYVVKEGETLYSIATKHGMQVNELQSLNGIENTMIMAGQTLKISSEHSSINATEERVVEPVETTASSESFSVHEIGFNGGISTIKHDQTNVTGDLEQINPDKTFATYEIFTTFDGICDDKANRPYLSYSYATNDDFKHQYILAGLNHYYAGEMATFYAGLLVGYGELTWKYNPIGAQDTDFSTTGFIGGVQVGAEVPLSASIALNFNLKALAQDYTTTFDPYAGVSSYMEHPYTATALVGLVFKF